MELKLILESLLFAAQKPMSPHELRAVLGAACELTEDEQVKAFKKVATEDITRELQVLAQEHEQAARTYRLACVAGSWQFVSLPDYAPWLKALLGVKVRPPRLSQPALETLAIIAYRQPVTRAEVEQVRGVAVDGVMQTLLERGLVVVTGRAEVIGRPTLYGTTPAFLEYFGLAGLEALPAADELRRIPVQRPESLLTVDPNLATAPADAAPTETTSLESVESGPRGDAGGVAEQPSPQPPSSEPAK